MKVWRHLVMVTLVTAATLAAGELEDTDTGRGFPLLAPYIGVDFLQNWSSLATLRNAVFTLTKDTITLVGMNLMWIVLHAVFWDGNAATLQDVMDSLLSPGVRVELQGELEGADPTPVPRVLHRTDHGPPLSTNQRSGYSQQQQAVHPVYPVPAQDRVSLDPVDTLVNSVENELSFEKFWNFFADPDIATRNLWLNIGFAAGSHLMFILPTYLGTREVAPVRSDFPLLADTADTEPLRLWNRLFCPQCILNIVAGNTVVWLGKTLWWTFMSTIPDVIGFGPETEEETSPRMIQESEEGILETISKSFAENVEEMLFTARLKEAFEVKF